MDEDIIFCLESSRGLGSTLLRGSVSWSVKQGVCSGAGSLLLGLWLLHCCKMLIARLQLLEERACPGKGCEPLTWLWVNLRCTDPHCEFGSVCYTSAIRSCFIQQVFASECSGMCWDLEAELIEIEAFMRMSRDIYTTGSPMLPVWIHLGPHKEVRASMKT